MHRIDLEHRVYSMGMGRHYSSTLNTHFPHVFVIHLEGSHDRIKNLLLLNQLGLRYSVVDALHWGEHDDLNDFSDYIVYRNVYSSELFEANIHNSVSKGSACLTLTILMLLRYCRRLQMPRILIFEDDVLVHRDHEALLQKAMDQVPGDWDVLQLGSKQLHRQNLHGVNEYWNTPDSNTWGTHAYAISEKAYDALERSYERFEYPVDVALQKLTALHRFVSVMDIFITFLLDVTTNIQNKTETYQEWRWSVGKYVTALPRAPVLDAEPRDFGNGWDNIYRILNAVGEESGGGEGGGRGYLLYDFMDEAFGWNSNKSRVPARAWCGIVHHPFRLPEYFGSNLCVAHYLQNEPFLSSATKCRALITLSQYLRDQIATSGMVPPTFPIVALKHPIILRSRVKFTMQAFETNPHKKLLAVGWSFRRLSSIYLVQVPPTMKKCWLSNNYDKMDLLRKECTALGITLHSEILESVEVVGRTPLTMYQKSLASNLVFLDFTDASANNAVVECIATHTPMIIRRIPPILEYLGVDYPLYFDRLEEVSSLVEDSSRIESARNHLERIEKNDHELKIHYFISRLFQETDRPWNEHR